MSFYVADVFGYVMTGLPLVEYFGQQKQRCYSWKGQLLSFML